MPLFSRRDHTHRSALSTSEPGYGRRSHRAGARRNKDPDRVAGGYKAALANPNTTHEGRQHAEYELEAMGRGREAHVPLVTKIKRALGIRSTPRRQRRVAASEREYY
ncbi:hypothetical protein PHLGIDRAFT_343033 [Phlebiopsis gigantea 11061_1 CR5-6]|uniref:Uncharacterized protein n=1 Tax=Phlebiopsis gigantea (strain 11061_1 CR5-6) TaxID=745531 RepID=A0A0C3SAG5_PHLG1|nr:hypothetical protein PHLGIDRAFT_343033 [Phlebiopsis gigantea 11061_1 CR5-6]